MNVHQALAKRIEVSRQEQEDLEAEIRSLLSTSSPEDIVSALSEETHELEEIAKKRPHPVGICVDIGIIGFVSWSIAFGAFTVFAAISGVWSLWSLRRYYKDYVSAVEAKKKLLRCEALTAKLEDLEEFDEFFEEEEEE